MSASSPNLAAIRSLQQKLQASGRYRGDADGVYGPLTKAAILTSLTDGPDTLLTEGDYSSAAAKIAVTPPHIKAIAAVESSGAGFASSRPVLLFEPHRFSKATGRKFDLSHPGVSYPKWDRTRYPKGQAERYEQLLTAISLDVAAGFASASYGKFQILGENYAACGFLTSYDFAVAQAYDERRQLDSLVQFLLSKGLAKPLAAGNWEAVAEGYNGTAYRQNQYHLKLAKAFKAAGGK